MKFIPCQTCGVTFNAFGKQTQCITCDSKKNKKIMQKNSKDRSHSSQILIHKSTIRKSCFTDTPIRTMDFFLNHFDIYFTPTTASLTMKEPTPTIKDTMRLLHQNSYLSKFSKDGTVYFITRENREFWVTDFKNHVMELERIKEIKSCDVTNE